MFSSDIPSWMGALLLAAAFVIAISRLRRSSEEVLLVSHYSDGQTPQEKQFKQFHDSCSPSANNNGGTTGYASPQTYPYPS